MNRRVADVLCSIEEREQERMDMRDCYFEYYEANGVRFFNAVLKPEKEGTYPTVLVRDPYVDEFELAEENAIVERYAEVFEPYLEAGFAVVYQHCRGRGKSGGDCIPYINEHEDSRAMLDWVREQPFYSGRLYLKGGSYRTSVWYAAAPYAEDIKGAIFSVQVSDRYTICYTNGFLKKALHCNWYVNKMYKMKAHLKKNYTKDTLNTLPLTGITKEIFGETAEDFEELIRHPRREDDFWNTRYGGIDARDAEKKTTFPMLFTSAWFDIYTGGMFDLWNSLSEEIKKRAAFVVSAYGHSERDGESPICFPQGKRNEKFPLWELQWFSALEKDTENPFVWGKITYYSLFEEQWKTEARLDSETEKSVSLGNGIAEYSYNPFSPPSFRGGLSRNFGGTAYQTKPFTRSDIVTVYTDRFERDTVIKGKMTARLAVSTDCDDTCFLIRVSLEKPDGDFGLRDDLTSVLLQRPDYRAGEWTELDFSMDEISVKISEGERLRIDLSSADSDHYVRHTNLKGLFSEQTTARIAHNRIDLEKSVLTLPVCED